MSKSNSLVTREGHFNWNFFGYFQILGRPQPEEKPGFVVVRSNWSACEDIEPAKTITSFIEGVTMPSHVGLASKILNVFSKKQANDVQKEVWERVVSMSPLLWAPRRMAGAEYENGRFEACVAAGAIEGNMQAAIINDIEVRTALFPSTSSLNYLRYDGVAKTLQRSWKDDFNVDLPYSINTTAYVIAPASKIDAVREMLRMQFAFAVTEPDSHRGIGFTGAVAYQSLDDQEQKKLASVKDAYDHVAWYELFERVFITTDPEMFEKAQTAFGVSNQVKAPKCM